MKFVQTPTCTLYASISASAVSLRLSPYPKDLAGNKLAIGDFGSAPCITIDPKVRGIEEIISFATMTDNGDNTCTLSGLTRGLSSKSPYTASGTSTPHSASALVVFSNNPQMYDNLVDKDSAQTVTAVKTFTASPIVPTPTTDFQTATKAYADGLTYSGAPNADTTTKGIVEEATQTEVDARTTTGGTGAKLFPPLDKLRSTQLSDYVATDTGSANAYAIAPAPAITAYTAGQVFSFKAANTNTLTSTIAVSGLTTKTIKRAGSALGAGDIISGQIYIIEYDGTDFQLLSATNTAPSGTINMFAGASAPTGWLLCNGASYLQATYPVLFAVIGTTFGSADGTHFNVPDMRGRVPVGVGTGTGGGAAGTGLPTGGSALTALSLAGWKGEETHTLTSGELATHTHALAEIAFSAGGVTGVATSNNGTAVGPWYPNTGNNAGGGGAHNNIQPVMGINFIIKT